MQGRFKRDSGAAGDPEQQPGGTGSGSTQAAGDSGTATPGTTAAGGRMSVSSGMEAGRITGLDGSPGPRIALRNWRISTRLVSLLALPVVTASALGGLRINSSLENIGQLEHMKTLTDITEQATGLAAALQEERDASAGPLASRQRGNDSVASAREFADRALKRYQTASDNISVRDPVFKGVRATLLSIGTQLASLNEIRDAAYSAETGIAQTVSQYDGLVQSLLSLSQDMAQATNNPEMIQSTRALAAFSAAKEYESIQRAVISAAFATTGRLNPNDYEAIRWSYAYEDTQLTKFETIYGSADAAQLLKPIEGGNDTISAHDTLRDRIAASQTAITKIHSSYLDWDDNARAKIQAMNQIEQSLLNEMQQKALKLQSEARREALISGAVILLVLGVAVVGAFVVARSMIRSLRRLQETAQDVAQKRLPELVKQLSESDPQDVDTSVESIGINSRDEIGQVARAFDEVHSEAVRLAAEQALLRGNVNAMFTNLSRRSQGLIQRQLSLISELESREADPDQLSSLFKLDHLATRMRRNGENLLVLAGEEPGRRWTRPVPLVDVLRAAASEVEQYERIELTSVPSAEVTGRIVNDLVHLLAELLENATSFSSPQTKVRVTGHSLPDGRVLIEIHDTGIGLSPEDLADINERLANPPTVDVSVSRRMGLFVVGRLSLRHGIRIQLRPSDSGGTTALVMLPVDVTQGGANPKSMNSGRPAGTPQAPAGSGVAGAFSGTPRAGAAPQRGQVGGGAPRPALDSGAGRPGGAPPQPGTPQPGTPHWAAQDGPQDFPDDRGLMDTPRGHEDVEAAPAFDAFDTPVGGSRGDFGRTDLGQQGSGDPYGQQGRPGSTQDRPAPVARPGGFPPPQPQSTGPAGFRSDVFGGRPGPIPRQSGQDAQNEQGGPGGTPPASGGGTPGRFPVPPLPAAADQQGGQGFGQGRTPQEIYGTGQYAVPGQGGPGDTAEFPAIRAEASPASGGGNPTGEFRAPEPPQPGQFPGRPGGLPQRGSHGPQGSPGWNPGTPGSQDPFDTGAQPVPGRPDEVSPVFGGDAPGQYPVPRRQDRPGRPGDSGQFPVQYPDRFPPQPQQDTPPPFGEGTPGRHPAAQLPAPQPAERRPAPQRPEPQLPPAAEPMALPPAPTRGDEPTPIFSSMESDWFRTGQAERMQQIHVEQGARGQQAPPPRPMGRTAPPQRPRTDRPGFGGPQRQSGAAQPAAQATPAAPAPAPAAPTTPVAQPLPRETPNWRTSPNDALRQRAEQVREPSAGGVTPSGLPRRVPRANLVPGGAAQQAAPQGGPQVSRAPDDVRGRLTNLRRGIQQGRQAGGNTDGLGFGPNHQER
ncbi:nitrate- and nitrite sensing domain-containing protein [Streptomyces sp.]|uniref:sensor histidine kinase n=1 Tax=Streptomyces sp. TaxID=1931 RepID=UPI002F4072F3